MCVLGDDQDGGGAGPNRDDEPRTLSSSTKPTLF